MQRKLFKVNIDMHHYDNDNDDINCFYCWFKRVIWEKVFKSGLNKFCGRQLLKNFKGHGLLKQIWSCLPQNWLSPLLNTCLICLRDVYLKCFNMLTHLSCHCCRFGTHCWIWLFSNMLGSCGGHSGCNCGSCNMLHFCFFWHARITINDFCELFKWLFCERYSWCLRNFRREWWF